MIAEGKCPAGCKYPVEMKHCLYQQGKATYLLYNHSIYMNIHHHLVKHRILDYKMLGESCTGNTSFLLPGLLSGEKIQGSEFRPHRTFIQTIKFVIWQLRVGVVSHYEDLILRSQWMQKMAYLYPGGHISHSHSFFPHCKWFPEAAKLLLWSLRTFVLKNHKENGNMVSCVEDIICINISRKYAAIEMLILAQLRTCKKLRVKRFSHFFSTCKIRFRSG